MPGKIRSYERMRLFIQFDSKNPLTWFSAKTLDAISGSTKKHPTAKTRVNDPVCSMAHSPIHQKLCNRFIGIESSRSLGVAPSLARQDFAR